MDSRISLGTEAWVIVAGNSIKLSTPPNDSAKVNILVDLTNLVEASISASKTIPSGNSFVIAGPVTVASGQTLTVSGTMKVI